jgi:hypothetical protein
MSFQRRAKKRLIGFQIADSTGKNIQGDASDPLDLASFEVIAPVPGLLRAVAEIAAPGYLLMPIYEGDIQEAVVLHALRT